MPKSNIYFGYAMIVIGVLLLLLTFYLGYGSYKAVFASATSQSATRISNSTMAAGTILGVISGLGGSSFMLFIVAIIMLLVMISIGGRLIKYGIEMLSIVKTREAKPKGKK